MFYPIKAFIRPLHRGHAVMHTVGMTALRIKEELGRHMMLQQSSVKIKTIGNAHARVIHRVGKKGAGRAVRDLELIGIEADPGGVQVFAQELGARPLMGQAVGHAFTRIYKLIRSHTRLYT